MGFSGNVIILAILYYGGSLVQSDQISIGELTSFFLYTAYVGSSLVGLSSWFSSLNKGAGAGDRIFKLLESQSIIESTGFTCLIKEGKIVPIKGHIQFKNVEFSYPTRPDAKVLNNMSFELQAGKTVAIVGHSGSGKSTIAQLLLRFYDVDSGFITIDDEPLQNINPSWLRGHVMGFVSQEPVLFAASIKENIRYGRPDATDEQVYEAAVQANAHDFIKEFPLGYDTFVGERGHAVSVFIS